MRGRSLGLTLILALAACAPIAACDQQRTEKMSKAGWTTHCFGRLLVDLPSGAKIAPTYRIWSNEMLRLALSPESLPSELAERESDLRLQPHETEGSVFARRVDHEAKGSATLLAWSLPSWTEGYTAESYFVVEGKAQSSVYKYVGEVEATRLDQALQNRRDFSAGIHPLSEAERPNGPGYCVDGAVIAGKEFQSEAFSIEVKLPSHPDAVLELFASTQAEPDESLLERAGGFLGTEVLGRIAGMKTLRRGERDVGPIRAEEYLLRATEGGQTSYIFKWEAPGKSDSIAEPNISVSLGVLNDSKPDDDSAPKQPPSFNSDEEAMQLWDGIIDSVRLRPGAV